MDHNHRPWSLIVLALLMAACGRIDGDATSLDPQTTTVATTAVSDASSADSSPISGLRPAASSYRQRYLSDFAPLIVHCMGELGWEATYDLQLGVLLAEVPPAQKMERDGAMFFCVAGSHNYHEIYAY